MLLYCLYHIVPAETTFSKIIIIIIIIIIKIFICLQKNMSTVMLGTGDYMYSNSGNTKVRILKLDDN